MYGKPYGQSLKAQRDSRLFGFVFSRCKATGETSATVLSPANRFRLLICFKNPLRYEQTKLPNFHHWFVRDGYDKPDLFVWWKESGQTSPMKWYDITVTTSCFEMLPIRHPAEVGKPPVPKSLEVQMIGQILSTLWMQMDRRCSLLPINEVRNQKMSFR